MRCLATIFGEVPWAGGPRFGLKWTLQAKAIIGKLMSGGPNNLERESRGIALDGQNNYHVGSGCRMAVRSESGS